MKKAFFIIALSLGITFICADNGYADGDKIKIRYGFSHWPPFSIGETKPYSGIDWDVAQELASLLNLELVIRRCSFKRCLAEAQAGGIDLISGLAINSEREEYLSYIQPEYSAVDVAFLTRKGESNKLNNYDDLYSLRIGSVAKSEYFEPFNTDDKINKYEASEEVILLNMLANKRLDAIIGTNPNLAYQALMQNLHGSFEEAVYSPNKSVPVYFSFSKKSKNLHLKEQFEKAMNLLVQNGTIEKIHKKYR